MCIIQRKKDFVIIRRFGEAPDDTTDQDSLLNVLSIIFPYSFLIGSVTLNGGLVVFLPVLCHGSLFMNLFVFVLRFLYFTIIDLSYLLNISIMNN